MYRKIKRTKLFNKDSIKAKLTDQHYSKFIIYVGKLLASEELPSEAQDHPLKGNYQGYREFHVSGDILVIYKVTEDTLYLARIGTHAQLFK
jgi:mRNA interferase YafQ